MLLIYGGAGSIAFYCVSVIQRTSVGRAVTCERRGAKQTAGEGLPAAGIARYYAEVVGP